MKMKFLKKVTAVAVAFAVLLVSSQASSPASIEHVVEIKGMRFDPESIVLHPGDIVTWINRDIVPHTASAQDGSWSTGTLLQNESKSLAIQYGMVTAYVCAFHPNMIGGLDIVPEGAATDRAER